MSEVLDSEGMLDDIASTALVTAFDLLLRRELWVLVTQTAMPEGMVFVHGPYMTRNQAVKAAISTEITPHGGGVMVRRLITATADGSDSD
jgi:hypothetical protein